MLVFSLYKHSASAITGNFGPSGKGPVLGLWRGCWCPRRAGSGSHVRFRGRAARQQLSVHHRLRHQHLVFARIQALLLQHPLVDQRHHGEHQAADDGRHPGKVKGRVVIPKIIVEVSWKRKKVMLEPRHSNELVSLMTCLFPPWSAACVTHQIW